MYRRGEAQVRPSSANLGAVPRGPAFAVRQRTGTGAPRQRLWQAPGAAFDLVGWVLDLADVWHGPVSRAGT